MKKLYVGNLPYRLERQELEDLFASCGEVSEIYLVKDRNKRRLKGFGFVTFSDLAGANAALKLDGSEFYGRTLKVSVAKEQSGDENTGDEHIEEGYLPMPLGFKRWVAIVLVSAVVAGATSYFVCNNLLNGYQLQQHQMGHRF